jgi:orotidine-5'-phosphate decarboxylase
VSPIAFALDFASAAEARAAAQQVAPAVGMLKVGLELFVHAGPEIVSIGRDLGLPVFLDLKLHDIPETVERAVAQASRLGAAVVTVHASGGRTMLKRAVDRAKSEGGTLSVCAVTVLTSLDARDLGDIGFADAPNDAATRLARLAYDEGVRWFVSSPAEVASIRKELGPDAVLVTPGVRPSSGTSDDQKRVATPADAIRNGANWLVVGRPIRDAADPLAAARAIADEAAGARS